MSEKEPTATPAPSIWTASQRRAICCLLIISGIGLLVQAIRRRTYVAEDWRSRRTHVHDTSRFADDGIDPNHAEWQALASIPSLGEKRAQQIVAYRTHFLAIHGAQAIAFRSPADLQHVKGIGAATAANLKPYLTFPAGEPTDRPATKR